jgi:peptidoglycan/LPS O-acetylase OafA/YrhL
VSFFFALSGYILAYAYPDFSKPGAIRKFYVARVARVWPLHIATMLIWVLLIYKLDPAVMQWENGIVRIIATVFMVQSWVPIEVWATSVNGVSWSISTEIFFYLLFPIIVSQFSRRWKFVVGIELLLIVAILIFSSSLPKQDPFSVSLNSMIYFFPPARLLEFIVGVGLFYVTRNITVSEIALTKIQWTLIEVAALIFTFLLMLMTKSHAIEDMIGRNVSFYISTAGSFPAFAILIGVYSFEMGYVSRVLRTRPFVFLGELSFALYLVHYAVVIYFKTSTEVRSCDWI